ncbi:hypothetical protein [Saccharopolyspora sp. CA-218241]|uniref:hypothetical protein n=1 Tax=Saccharopolyspora sp. CA-218241 TaxID=3240027 RepID=UPI003D996E79
MDQHDSATTLKCPAPHTRPAATASNGSDPVVTVVEHAIPGLGISPQLRKDLADGAWRFTGGWNLVHTGSGRCVLPLFTPVNLGPLREAAALLAHFDWTLPAEVLRATPGLQEEAYALGTRVTAAAAYGCPLNTTETSWMVQPPSWHVTLTDLTGEPVGGVFCSNYGDAEATAVELGSYEGLGGAFADITISRENDHEWRLRCCRYDCGVVLESDEGVAQVSTADRDQLVVYAADLGWRQLDDRRLLCPACSTAYQSLHT